MPFVNLGNNLHTNTTQAPVTQPIFICAQPANFYYAWQIDAMLLSFEKYGEVDLTRCHIVCAVQSSGIHPHFSKVYEKWKKKRVFFQFYDDTRDTPKYISSVRPHVLKKHWEKHKWMKDEYIFYHDCDIALTRPMDFSGKFNDECHLSDTATYIGHEYIKEKGHDLDKKMCEIANVPLSLIENRESEAGGAQYMIRPGLDADYWQYVYDTCEEMFYLISKEVALIQKENPEWHSLQIWCADMWAVLWGLWKKGWKTPTVKDWDFSWGISTLSEWERLAIFHNAGVTGEMHQEMIDNNKWNDCFYKAIWQHDLPLTSWTPKPELASSKYFELICQSTDETLGLYNKIENPTLSVVIPTYRRPALLQEALKSFLDQNDENCELIIVNDDEEVEYFYNDRRVKCYNLPKINSFTKKLEISLKLAKSPYVYRLDDDDLLVPGALGELRKAIQKAKGAELVRSYAHWYISMHNPKENGVVENTVNTGNVYKRDFLHSVKWTEMPYPPGEDAWLNDQAKSTHTFNFKTMMYRWGGDYHLTHNTEDGDIKDRTASIYPEKKIYLKPKYTKDWWSERKVGDNGPKRRQDEANKSS